MMLTRRAHVAYSLSQAGATGVSGESLARELGVSRAAVAKHVSALREIGYGIAAVRGSGYRLDHAPDLCIPEAVAPLLSDPLWLACEGSRETVSTNEDAKRLARSGAREGTLVLAARQTGGRGRFGRNWASPEGGVYASMVVRPPLPPAELGPLGLAIALGVARALDPFGVPAALKWPNDVLADGRKIAGILVEMAAEADRAEWVVIGCGVNVAHPGTAGAAAVREWAPGIRVATVAAAVADGMAAAYRGFVRAGFASLAGEYRARGALWGREVVVRDGADRVVARGTAVTVDDSGALVVAGPDGERAVVAGEVTLKAPR